MQTLLMPSASSRCTRGAEREQAGALRLEPALRLTGRGTRPPSLSLVR